MSRLVITGLRTIYTTNSIFQLCPVAMIPEREERIFPDLSSNGAQDAVRCNSLALPEHLRGLWLPIEGAYQVRDRLAIRFFEADQHDSGYDLTRETVTSAVRDWNVRPEFAESPIRRTYTWGVETLDTLEQVRTAIQAECVRHLTEGDMGTVTDPDGRSYLIEIVARLVTPGI